MNPTFQTPILLLTLRRPSLISGIKGSWLKNLKQT